MKIPAKGGVKVGGETAGGGDEGDGYRHEHPDLLVDGPAGHGAGVGEGERRGVEVVVRRGPQRQGEDNGCRDQEAQLAHDHDEVAVADGTGGQHRGGLERAGTENVSAYGPQDDVEGTLRVPADVTDERSTCDPGGDHRRQGG
jgi:hypothetical protein